MSSSLLPFIPLLCFALPHLLPSGSHWFVLGEPLVSGVCTQSAVHMAALCTGSRGSSVYLACVAALCTQVMWHLCVPGSRGSSVYPGHVAALCTRLTWQLCVPGSRGSLGTWSHGICVPDSEAFGLKEATLRGCRRIREALSRPLGLALPGVPPVWGLHLLTCSMLSRADPSAPWSSWLGHSPGVGDSVLHSDKTQVSPPVKGGPGASSV